MKIPSRYKKTGFVVLAAGLLSQAVVATEITFTSSTTAGVTLGGGMKWNSYGGGHLYNEYWDNDDQILFSDPNTYLNSFQMNALPWQNYGGPGGYIDVDARNSAGEIVWSQTLDLRSYTTWSNWLTVSVNVPNVAQLYFHAPGGTPHANGFWPSVDNLVINQAPVATSTVPVPDGGMTLWLLGMGLGGLRLLRRKA